MSLLLGTVVASAADPESVETNEVTVEAGQTLPSSGSVQFSDVGAGHWAKTAIQTAVSKGYVSGYPGGKFKPEQAITRGEFMKMVVTALELPTEAEEGTWYEPYVKAAQNQSLYVAVDFANNEEQWNKDITRQEMARIAVRAIGQSTSENDKWMYLATKSGLITGLGKGVLGKDKTTTRAQSVTIIERILKVNAGETLPVDKYAVSNAELAWHGTNIFTIMPEVFVSDESKLKGRTVEELWNEEMMTITSKDGKYKAQLEALIAIDMEDPNDPNWKLLRRWRS
ncbi:S-layer homology domain-containing protein [Paenibacillus sp. D2_2]|uniref:S-layer homology domain-containing protein n=1 Tax=Paenibacillus sp. D2_2 TaxID=3073092 RepID=UPI00281552B4|nr:S-layer homology domain-containing protein [Paenibacillus sp. D2_2]WMT42058.1 S-layer homology domain-containing protein [Paenibacillus sp. D2_2]